MHSIHAFGGELDLDAVHFVRVDVVDHDGCGGADEQSVALS
jgi:hypothetical protein